MKRPVPTGDQIERGFDRLREGIKAGMKKNGEGIFISHHETLGIISEEVLELKEAIRKVDVDNEAAAELMDIAVAALWGYISILTGKMF